MLYEMFMNFWDTIKGFIPQLMFCYDNREVWESMRIINVLKLPLCMIFLLSNGIFISNAFAYIDPGTGSLILQMLLGALFGIGIAIKVYWQKIKNKFSDSFATKK